MGQPFSVLLSPTIIFTGKCQLLLPLFSQRSLLQLLLKIDQTRRTFSLALLLMILAAYIGLSTSRSSGSSRVAASKVTSLSSLESSQSTLPDSGSACGVCLRDGETQLPLTASSLEAGVESTFPFSSQLSGKVFPLGSYRNKSFTSLELRDTQYVVLWLTRTKYILN